MEALSVATLRRRGGDDGVVVSEADVDEEEGGSGDEGDLVSGRRGG